MYVINQSTITDENGQQHTTYGISYNDTTVKDISINKAKVENLISLCNKLDLSPIHIYDVIDDFLVDFEA